MKRQTSLTIEEDLVKRLKEIADQENRTLSNLIESILIAYLSKEEK